MFQPVSIRPLPKYKIWIKYSDGTEGEVDLSHLVGKGVFSSWNNFSNFEKVRLGQSGELIWDDNIDLCPDAIYLKLTGQSPQTAFPHLKSYA